VKPLAIDLFCGLGGWAEGLLAEGYDIVGFDIERHEYGAHRYRAQLVLQDVLTLRGSQFKDATLIVASPPCQEYSYMAMPWKRAKAKALAIRADETGRMLEDLNRLFHACFRIQAQASVAAGRHIPMVVENVRGAQPWVGRARWNFGSFYLWGDVPALMPFSREICRRSAVSHGPTSARTIMCHLPSTVRRPSCRASARFNPPR
jgi:site-specific DNA-cytosine methylase